MAANASSETELDVGSAVPDPAPAGIVSDELWAIVEPLLPRMQQRMGRKRLSDRLALEGILYVLGHGISWQQLPIELGFGSGFTCWRRLVEWQEHGIWSELEAVLAGRLPEAGRIEWSRAELPAPEAGPRKSRRARSRFVERPGRGAAPKG